MGSALDYLPSLAIGTKTTQITGVNADGFTASGYAALVQAVTGSQPALVPAGGKKVKLILTTAQNEKMKKWLGAQVSAGIKLAKSPSNLEIVAGPFITPVVMKYAIPFSALLFVAGWLAHTYFGKR